MAENMQGKGNINNKETRLNPLEKVANFFDKIIVVLSIVLTAVITVNLVSAVFSRYVLGSPIYWADELSLLIFAWLTFLGACLAIKRSEMAAVTIILDRLHSTPKFILNAIIQISILVFSVVIGYYSYLWISSPSVLNMISPTLNLKLWWVYSIVPFSMLCIFVFTINNFYKDFLVYRAELKGGANQ